jgi:hypothetical protein
VLLCSSFCFLFVYCITSIAEILFLVNQNLPKSHKKAPEKRPFCVAFLQHYFSA